MFEPNTYFHIGLFMTIPMVIGLISFVNALGGNGPTFGWKWSTLILAVVAVILWWAFKNMPDSRLVPSKTPVVKCDK